MIAVIGCGVSGAACARELRAAGRNVTVFDKGRGPGGRASTRRAPTGTRFDHGAQYFTARSEEFNSQLADWIDRGVIAEWDGRFADVAAGSVVAKTGDSPKRYVGAPGMSAIVQDLASGVDCRFGVPVGAIAGEPGDWALTGAERKELGRFEAVVVSAPAPQAAALLRDAAPALAAQAAAVPMSGCWAVLAAFPQALAAAFDGGYISGSAVSWAARDSSKPGRDADGETWTLHGSPEWSQRHLETEPMQVVSDLLDAFWAAAGIEPVSPREAWAHRWRFALPPAPLNQSCLWDPALGLGVCGDWCGGPRIEGDGAAVARWPANSRPSAPCANAIAAPARPIGAGPKSAAGARFPAGPGAVCRLGQFAHEAHKDPVADLRGCRARIRVRHLRVADAAADRAAGAARFGGRGAGQPRIQPVGRRAVLPAGGHGRRLRPAGRLFD